MVATLGAGHGVDFVDDDGLQASEIGLRYRLREQDSEAFRRGEQDIRRRVALLTAFFGRRVAGTGFDAYRQSHVLHRQLQVARDVGSQRLQRADIDGVQSRGFARSCQGDEAGKEAGQRFAAARRRDE